MKKYISAIFLMGFVLSPAFVFASVTPSTSTLSDVGNLVWNYSGSKYNMAGLWLNVSGNELYDAGGGTPNNGALFSAFPPSVLSGNKTLVEVINANGAGTYSQINSDRVVDCSALSLSDCETLITNTGGGTYDVSTFTVTAPAQTATVLSLEFPTSTAPTLLAYVNGLLTDNGFFNLILLVIGIPFSFWLMEKLIAFISERKEHLTELDKEDKKLEKHRKRR